MLEEEGARLKWSPPGEQPGLGSAVSGVVLPGPTAGGVQVGRRELHRGLRPPTGAWTRGHPSAQPSCSAAPSPLRAYAMGLGSVDQPDIPNRASELLEGSATWSCSCAPGVHKPSRHR